MRTFVMTWPGRIAVLVLIAAVGGGAAFVARSNAAAPKSDLRTATVTRGSVTQTVSVSGSVNASGQARLAFKTGGRVAQVYVGVGQAVTLGQPLAKLDTTDLETALATAQQNLANAQASYQKQLLSASDTQKALEETQRSTANDIATAQASLAKIRANYATAKQNYTNLTTGAVGDMTQYRAAVDALRTQVQLVLGDIALYSGGDVTNARTSLYAADISLGTAQGYAGSTLANALTEFSSARDGIIAATQVFDAVIDAGNDTSAASASYQTVQLNYSAALTRLSNTIDTLSGMVSSAQTSANSAQSSLNTSSARGNLNYDLARSDLTALQNLFIGNAQYPVTAKSRTAQAGTPLSTISDAVNGSLANAIGAVSTAQDRAATSIRSAQSAVANIPFNLQSAQVSVDNAANAVATAKSNLDNAVLTAPSAGIVASIANQVGEFVSSAGGTSNAAFIVLTNTTAMVLHGTIGEADVSKLKLGQVANVTVDALSGTKMTGKVTSLDPVATISQGVPVYGIDVAIDVPAAGVKAGMSGTAAVILASKQSVLTVPNTTIRTVNGQRGVQVLKDGEVVDTAVQFGLANDTVTEVVSGLAEGDTIVIPTLRATTSAQPNRQGQGIVVPGGGIGR
jgi:multidrug resistance efflux pump